MLFSTANMDSSGSVGKYVLGPVLGVGTFATVIAAKHMDTGHLVAIKMLDKGRVYDGTGILDLVKREICIMSQLRHPNVVRLFDVIETETHFCLVMEYLPQGDLFEKLRLEDLSEHEARRFFQQLISAVHFCHRRGVYHRDIKLENLLLDANSDLKLGDFGVSAMSGEVKEDGLLHSFCGTDDYMAPEVLRRKGYKGSATDLWSCGVVLYRLLSGKFPFEGENSVYRTYTKIMKARFDIPPGLSPGARSMIRRLLVVDPKKRLTVAQILEDEWFKEGYVAPDIHNINGAEHVPVTLDAFLKDPPFQVSLFEQLAVPQDGIPIARSGQVILPNITSQLTDSGTEPSSSYWHFLKKLWNGAKELSFTATSTEREL